jgi:PKD repeat protein
LKFDFMSHRHHMNAARCSEMSRDERAGRAVAWPPGLRSALRRGSRPLKLADTLRMKAFQDLACHDQHDVKVHRVPLSAGYRTKPRPHRGVLVMLAIALLAFTACGSGGGDSGSVVTGLEVEGGAFMPVGSQGGAFAPAESSYQVINRSAAPVEWSVSSDQSWVMLSQAGGSLDPLQAVTVVATLTSAVGQLPVGTHTCTLSFANLLDGQGDTSRDVIVTVGGLVTVGIEVEGSSLMPIGSQGGPFSPSETSYQLTNRGESAVEWVASADQSWVSLSQTNGSLGGLSAATIDVMLTSAADQLAAGTHTCTLSFVNLTDGVGTTSREVVVTVTPLGSTSMTAATRTAGVAPLSVVFDSVGAASGVLQPSGADPDHNSSTKLWTYGDSASGLWQHTGKSKDRGVGYEGAHVYETPGTYRATLSVIDAGGTRTEYHQDIVVTDPATVFATKTFYVAGNGDDSDPGTIDQPFETVARGVQEAFVNNSSARLLLRRGDMFQCNESISLGSGAGPFLMGSYGQGVKPRIEFPQQSVGFSAAQSTNVRVMDLDLVSTSSTQESWAVGVSVGNQTTVLRCSFLRFGQAVNLHQRSEMALVDCEILDSTEYGLYAYGPDDTTAVHLAIMGNRFQLAGQHLLRTYCSRSVIQSNHFGDAGGGFTALKLCGRGAAVPSQFLCVNDNYLTTNTIDVMTTGPENGQSDQHMRFVLIEGNHWFSQGAGNHALQVRGSRFVVRNNIFNLAARHGIQVVRWGIGPIPDRVRIENNTAYSSRTGSFRLLGDVETSDLTIVRNNIIVAPNGSVHSLGGTIEQSNNLTENALLVAPSAGDFSLQAGSPAIDTGVGVAVIQDCIGNPRPVGSGIDIGAFERQ